MKKDIKEEIVLCEIAAIQYFIMSMDFIRIARNADGGAVAIIRS